MVVARNIRDRIDLRLYLWNKGAYDELIQDYHRDAEEALRNKSGNQTQEQRHHNFSNIKNGNCVKPFVLFVKGGLGKF